MRQQCLPWLAAAVILPGLLAADTLWLKDGSRLTGSILDLGDNSIAIQLERGRKTVFKKDIAKLEFSIHEASREVLDEDLVLTRSGNDLRGTVGESEDGQSISVAMKNGNKVTLPRGQVIKVLRRGESTGELETSLHYTRAIENDVQAALKGLKSDDDALRSRSEARLKQLGVFAWPSLDQALAATEKASGDAAERERRALERVAFSREVRKSIPDVLEQFEPRIYEVLESGTIEAREATLGVLMSRFPSESFDLARVLLFRSDEDPVLRAAIVGTLGGMHRNEELIGLYHSSRGQAQLSLAIALGKNRILIGLPTLIEALDMESRDLRRLAFERLKEFTGETLGFHPDDTPAARRKAIAAWQSWWLKHEKLYTEQAAAVIAKQPAETPQGQRARELWAKAGVAAEAMQTEEAIGLLRQATQVDPAFFSAYIQLASLLFNHAGKADEARRLLEDLLNRRPSGVRDSELAWVHYQLGSIHQIAGSDEAALTAFRACVKANPDFLAGRRALAELTYRRAVRGEGLDAKARRQLIEAARAEFQATIERIDILERDLVILVQEDLPLGDNPPFEIRAHNRGVLQIRKDLRRARARSFHGLARVESLLGDAKKAINHLLDALSVVRSGEDEGFRPLEIDFRNYLGILYEEIGEVEAALREFRIVSGQLDRQNETALQGVRRLDKSAPPVAPPRPSRTDARRAQR